MNMLLYIDPGTGSMLFAILIGILGALGYVIRITFVKIRFLLTSGKKGDIASEKIPYVIFSEGKRYWNVYEPLCKEFDKRGIDIAFYSASEDDPGLNSPYEHVKGKFIGENNKAFSKLNFINANIVISTTPGLDVYQWKRSRYADFYVHIPHAASDITLYRMFGIDYYDSILLSGEFQVDQIRKLEKLRDLPEKEVEIIGIPYMDAMSARLKANKIEPSDKTTVLLAPSWGPSAIFAKFGSSIIDALLLTGYHIIVRPHPQSFISEKDMMDELLSKYPESEQLEWNRDADNFDVLNRSDIMISDFSAVVFDFTLVFDKPVIHADTHFDKALYDAWWLDEELWTLDILPKIGGKLTKENLSEIKTIIDDCLTKKEYSQGRDTARKECWEHYGEGASKAVDYLEKKLKEIEKHDTDSNSVYNVNKTAGTTV